MVRNKILCLALAASLSVSMIGSNAFAMSYYSVKEPTRPGDRIETADGNGEVDIPSAVKNAVESVSSFLSDDKDGEYPDDYVSTCPEKGNIERIKMPGHEGNNEILVWTPYGYDEDTDYNVIMVVHGGGGDENEFIGASQMVKGTYMNMANVYDWVTYNDECDPFIVCAIKNRQDRELVSQEMIDALVCVSEKYSTHAKISGDTQEEKRESLASARDNIAIAGASNGCTTANYFMLHHNKYASRFVDMSPIVGIGESVLSTNGIDMDDMDVRSFFVGAGEREYDKSNPNKQHYYNSIDRNYEDSKTFSDDQLMRLYTGSEHDFTTWSGAMRDALMFTFPRGKTNTFDPDDLLTKAFINGDLDELGNDGTGSHDSDHSQKQESWPQNHSKTNPPQPSNQYDYNTVSIRKGGKQNNMVDLMY